MARDRRAGRGHAAAADPCRSASGRRPAPGACGAGGAAGDAADPPPPDLGAAAADLGRALTDERTARGRWRVVQAIVGWLPLALGIGWLDRRGDRLQPLRAPRATARRVVLQPIVAVALLGLLLLVPRLAALAAAGAVAIVVAAVPTALILSATGDAAEVEARATALGVTIVVAWLVGVGVAVARRLRAMPPRAGPVS